MSDEALTFLKEFNSVSPDPIKSLMDIPDELERSFKARHQNWKLKPAK